MNLSDTIVAISTPVGQGAIGIVRLSGQCALAIADKIFLAKDGQKPSAYKTYSVHYGWIIGRQASNTEDSRRKTHDAGRKIIDEVLLTVMRSPKSYTKEDIVEISCHSGILVLREILDLILANGAKAAEPGEFTKRAFLNGRIDLSKAEAVMDIINAKTRLALESGMRQLGGSLAEEIMKARQKLWEIIALLEVNIDFPEEEIGPAGKKAINKNIREAAERINSLLNSSNQGKILRDGISVVIVGRANVGKSSLLNALLREERAIVTPIAGTTRDAIEEIIDLKGIPLKIADTAGIIEPQGLIEKEALKRTQDYFEKAELVLLVFDSNVRLSGQDRHLIEKAKSKSVIAVLNKSDLKSKIDEAQIKKHFDNVVKISCLKQKGLKELEEKIIRLAWQGEIGVSDELIVTNSRHIRELRNAQDALGRARGSLKRNLSIEFIAEDLKICRNHLGYITGEEIKEDILDKIFSEFCIGK